jgi:hypothetical protein
VLLAALALALLASLTFGAGWFMRRHPFGLAAHYYRGAGTSDARPPFSHPILTAIDPRPGNAAFKMHASNIPAEGFSAVWEGYLLTPASRSYHFELESDDGSRLYLDGVRVIDNWGQHAARTVSAMHQLGTGHHRIRIEYEQVLGEARLELRWDGAGEGVMQPLAPNDVTPFLPAALSVRQLRPLTARTFPLTIAIWSGLLASGLFIPGALALTRLVRGDTRSRLLLAGIVAGGLFLNAIGSWWGLPAWGWLGWAPDEVVPLGVIEGLDMWFSSGWQQPYPAGHYYILAWLFSPILIAARSGLLEPPIPHTMTYLALFVLARVATVLMAALLLLLVHIIGQELYGPRAGAFAAFVTAFTIPFGFYSKVANLEVPYLFWFALSVFFYANFVLRRRAVDVYGYALAGILAICTKDQAYGLYLLPTVHIALLIWRDAGAAGSPRVSTFLKTVAGPFAAATAAFALIHNFAFNFSGFLGHVRIVTGEQSGNFRMFDSSLDGQGRLLIDALPLFRWMFGWTGLGLVALGLWRTWALGPSRRHAWILLPVLSYYLTFIAVIGYHYDRFWMPMALVAALVAGVGLEWLFRSGPVQLIRRAAAVAAMVWLFWRGVSIDGLMLIDSRYDAERWLGEHQRSGTTVYVGALSYLPRVTGLDIHPMAPTIEETLTIRPQFIIVNPEFMRRFAPERHETAWWRWLSGETSPYRIAYHKKQRPSWLALSYEPRLYSGVQDPYTNLGKINPEIVVFKRRESVRQDDTQ